MNIWKWPKVTPQADWHGGKTLWPVPLSNQEPGEVTIRKSDGRIGITGVPMPFDNTDDVRAFAAALLSAAEAWDAEL
jgi:hypothetical protein